MVKKIIIDPGHGGSDPGAVNLVREGDFNLAMAESILDNIKRLGGDGVIIARNTSLAGAISEAKKFGKNAVLISIHANAGGGTGFETFYAEGFYTGATKALVDAVHGAYAVSGMRNRGIKSDKTTRHKRLGILQDTPMSAVLIECGFVDNASDAALLNDPGFRAKMGEALARALMAQAGQAVNEPAPQPAPAPAPAPSKIYKVKILVPMLNVRSGPGTNYRITRVVRKNEVYTIVETKTGWGRLKSGAGWINVSSKYVKKA